MRVCEVGYASFFWAEMKAPRGWRVEEKEREAGGRNWPSGWGDARLGCGCGCGLLLLLLMLLLKLLLS